MTNTRDVIPDQNGTERLIDSETEMASVESNPITVDVEKASRGVKGCSAMMFSIRIKAVNQLAQPVTAPSFSLTMQLR